MINRRLILSSWRATRKQMPAASFAGYALEQAGGSIERARAFVPADGDDDFRGRVMDALDQVENEEMPLRASGERR
jgi:hypothetical protein